MLLSRYMQFFFQLFVLGLCNLIGGSPPSLLHYYFSVSSLAVVKSIAQCPIRLMLLILVWVCDTKKKLLVKLNDEL